jgi:ABC-type lipoprotein release transport system permease subunit
VFEDLRYRARILMRNAGVSLLFVAIALLATYLPSRRAMRVEAMATLRAK